METMERMRLSPGVMLLLAALGYAVYQQGAYHEGPHRFFAMLACGAGLLLIFGDHGRRAVVFAAAAIAPLLLSSVVSVLLSSDRSDARSTFLTLALVGIGFAAAMSIPAAHRTVAVDASIVIAAIVAVTAIWGVATHSVPFGRITEGVWRGSSSITYSNAAAAMVGSVAVLTFHLAATKGNRLHAVACTLMLAGFASTQSRGGALALLLFIVVTFVVLGPKMFARTAVSVAAGTAIASAPILFSAADSGPARPGLVVAGLVLGLIVTWSLFEVRDRFLHPVTTLAALGVGGALIAWQTGLSDPITERFTLRSGTTAGGEEAAVLFGDRAKEWSAAWEQFADSPIVGQGPGVVELRWSEAGRLFEALFVHNEYLELAVTHGVLGIVALMVTAYLFLRSGNRSELSTPVLLAVGMFMAHSTVDFLWHIPALPVFFAFLLGLSRQVPAEVGEGEAGEGVGEKHVAQEVSR